MRLGRHACCRSGLGSCGCALVVCEQRESDYAHTRSTLKEAVSDLDTRITSCMEYTSTVQCVLRKFCFSAALSVSRVRL